MKFKNLIITILLVGVLTPSVIPMKRKLITNDADTNKRAKIEVIDEPVSLPQDMLVYIFTFCAPFKKAQDVLNLMYTCKDWHNAIMTRKTVTEQTSNGQTIQREVERFQDVIVNIFSKFYVNESYVFNEEHYTQELYPEGPASTLLSQVWTLEKCGLLSLETVSSFKEITPNSMQTLQCLIILVSIAKGELDPKTQDKITGNTLLHAIGSNYDNSLLIPLLQLGANPLICNAENQRAYSKAIYSYDWPMLLCYIKHDRTNKNRTPDGETLLHHIVTEFENSGYEFFSDMVENILKLEIDINPQCQEGNTPLHVFIMSLFSINRYIADGSCYIASIYDYQVRIKPTLNALLKLGANPTITNHAGHTPRGLALQLCHEKGLTNDYNAIEVIKILENAEKEFAENAQRVAVIE